LPGRNLVLRALRLSLENCQDASTDGRTPLLSKQIGRPVLGNGGFDAVNGDVALRAAVAILLPADSRSTDRVPSLANTMPNRRPQRPHQIEPFSGCGRFWGLSLVTLRLVSST